MDFIASILSAIFIALIFGAMMVFGFVLLAWFAAVVLVFTAFIFLRGWYLRRYVSEATTEYRNPPVIDAEYKDISQ